MDDRMFLIHYYREFRRPKAWYGLWEMGNGKLFVWKDNPNASNILNQSLGLNY